MRLNFARGLALVLATSVHAQPAATGSNLPQPRPAPSITFPTPLYQMNDVSKSMNLAPQQIERLNQLTEQTQNRYRDRFSQLNSLGQAERTTRTDELNRQYANDWMKGTRDVFNENQLNRYQQLQYQYGGFNSLSDPDMQKRLNLTEEQRKNLRQSIDWSNQQIQDINRQGVLDRDKGLQLHRDYQRDYQGRFNKFLTPEQQKTWQQMTGDPYTFQPTFMNTKPRRE